MGKEGSDFDEFLALEQIAEQRKELESMCRLYAKAGTWDKFLAFEAKMRVERKREAEARQKQIAQVIKIATWGTTATLTLGGIVVLYFFTEFLKDLR